MLIVGLPHLFPFQVALNWSRSVVPGHLLYLLNEENLRYMKLTCIQVRWDVFASHRTKSVCLEKKNDSDIQRSMRAQGLCMLQTYWPSEHCHYTNMNMIHS